MSNHASPRATSPNNTPAKSRLTDQEKKDNHIASEKKRREAIRAGFDRLAEIVPGQSGNGRSEAVVLQATVAYTKEQIARKEIVTRIAVERGWDPKEVEEVYRRAEHAVRKREDESLAAAGDPSSQTAVAR